MFSYEIICDNDHMFLKVKQNGFERNVKIDQPRLLIGYINLAIRGMKEFGEFAISLYASGGNLNLTFLNDILTIVSKPYMAKGNTTKLHSINLSGQKLLEMLEEIRDMLILTSWVF